MPVFTLISIYFYILLPFFYPLKTLKTIRFSDVFRGERKGCRIMDNIKINGAPGSKWVKNLTINLNS